MIVEITPSPWIPLIDSAASIELSTGSSERYSKLRPLRGSLVRLMPPASRTLNPLLQASRAIMRPLARAELGIEARPKCDARGQRGGCVFLTEPRVDDTETRVAHQERWDTETRDAGGIARAHGSSRWDTLVPGLRDHRVFSHHTNYESESLVLGHLFLNLTRPHIGRRILCGSEPSLLRHNNLLLLLSFSCTRQLLHGSRFRPLSKSPFRSRSWTSVIKHHSNAVWIRDQDLI